MDKKYGRILTFDDVVQILVELSDPGVISTTFEVPLAQALAVLDERGLLTFPVDEPLFLLRGKDKLAPATIDNYQSLVQTRSNNVRHAQAAFDAAKNMREWQHSHPERVKIPDTEQSSS